MNAFLLNAFCVVLAIFLLRGVFVFRRIMIVKRESNNKCWKHDWEYLQYDHPENIWYHHQGVGLRVTCTGTMDFIHDRVCLRCGHREDQIPDYIAKREAEENSREERREKARQLAQ